MPTGPSAAPPPAPAPITAPRQPKSGTSTGENHLTSSAPQRRKRGATAAPAAPTPHDAALAIARRIPVLTFAYLLGDVEALDDAAAHKQTFLDWLAVQPANDWTGWQDAYRVFTQAPPPSATPAPIVPFVLPTAPPPPAESPLNKLSSGADWRTATDALFHHINRNTP